MSDKFTTGVQIPNIPTNARNPDTDCIRIYGKNDRVYARYPDGSEIELTQKKVRYYEVTTNSASQWSVVYTGDFVTVDFVTPIAIEETGTLGDQRIATLHRYDVNSANGRVVDSNAFVLGGQGLEYSGAGVTVRVRVEGY